MLFWCITMWLTGNILVCNHPAAKVKKYNSGMQPCGCKGKEIVFWCVDPTKDLKSCERYRKYCKVVGFFCIIGRFCNGTQSIVQGGRVFAKSLEIFLQGCWKGTKIIAQGVGKFSQRFVTLFARSLDSSVRLAKLLCKVAGSFHRVAGTLRKVIGKCYKGSVR